MIHDLAGGVISSWSDLFRGGHLDVGAIVGCCRSGSDPINGEGYLAYLDTQAAIEPVARGYVEEALQTYRACCYKATVVLLRMAVERMALCWRDEIRYRLVKAGLSLLEGATFAGVADRVQFDLGREARKSPPMQKLLHDAEYRLPSIAAALLRASFPTDPHPASVGPILPVDAHAALLVFPAKAVLLAKLTEWGTGYYPA